MWGKEARINWPKKEKNKQKKPPMTTVTCSTKKSPFIKIQNLRDHEVSPA